MERPTTVPEEAFWSEDENEWCLPERDEEGEHHGLVKWWRPDGTLCCATEYVHGTPHGTFTRFHENGEVSREGRFVDGNLHGTNVFRRSTSETTEVFPAGLGGAIARAEMDYDHGRVVAARCYDAKDRQCMENGDPYPETRPRGVPEDAHFRKREADGEYRWVSGSVIDHGDGTISRSGVWRFYTPNGVLVGEEPYEAGKLDGVAKSFDEEKGALVEEVTWKAGQKHGPSRTYGEDGALVEERSFVEGDAKGPRSRVLEEEERREGEGVAVRERGEFDDDEPIGVIEYLDDAGVVVARVDTGLPADLDATQGVLGATEGLAELSDALFAEKKVGAALFGLARAVGRHEAKPERLKEKLAALERPLSDQAASHTTRMTKAIISNIQRFGGGPDKCVNRVFEGIRLGGLPGELLRFAAGVLDDTGDPRTGLELVDAAIAIAPPDEAPSYEYTRALVRASLGDRDGALASIATLVEHAPDMGKGISCYMRALFPEWTFWPTTDSRRASLDRLTSLLTRSHTKRVSEAEAFRTAIQKSATRLRRYRERLLEVFGERSWIVPDVSHLLPEGPVEVPIPERYEGIGIHHLARQEWTRLTWLCHFAGLDELGLPEEAKPRADGVPTHMVAIARLYLAYGHDPEEKLTTMLEGSDVADASRHGEIVALTKELAGASDWFGLRIAEVADAPDESFIQEDENAFMSALNFAGNAETDLFDEHEEDEGDGDEDTNDEGEETNDEDEDTGTDD